MSPSRSDTFRGVYLPPWLFAFGLEVDAILTWGVMAKCAGRGRVLTGYSAARVAEIVGISTRRVRRAIDDLRVAKIIEVTPHKGGASVYRFLAHPGMSRNEGTRLTWTRLLAEKDAGGEQYWREW